MIDQMKKEYIKLDQCKKGYLYKISSRNLSLGVHDGNQGFIGIRTKFGDRYLFTEYHYDQGPPFGTVFPIEELCKVPDDIEINECGETCHRDTQRVVRFDKPVSQGGRGWYFLDTGEASGDIFPTSKMNQPLFEYLDKHER